MNDFDLEIGGGLTEFFPGDELTGTVRWVLDKAPKAIEVVLFWHTEGKGTRDSGIAGREFWESPGAFGEKSFTFTLPHAPHSFAGKLISLHWGLEAIAVKAKRTKYVEFTLSPSGEVIQLGDSPDQNVRSNDLISWLKNFRGKK